MIEFLFVLAFAAVLFITGISIVGMLAAMVVGFAIMALAGMIGIVFKLLPWLLVVGVVIWLVRDKAPQNSRCHSGRCYGSRYRD